MSWFLRKELGEKDLHPKKPMFAQDFEHIPDTIGLETPRTMIGTYSMLRTTGFLRTTRYHLLKTAVLKKVMNIAQLYMYFSVHFDS